MTTVIFYLKDSNYYSIECFGHSDYLERGKDIVCASISTMVQSIYVGIKEVLKLKALRNINEKDGLYSIVLNKNEKQINLNKSNVLFQTAYLTLKNLQKQYPKNLKLEEKTYVY